jgi:hypothetical protein
LENKHFWLKELFVENLLKKKKKKKPQHVSVCCCVFETTFLKKEKEFVCLYFCFVFLFG